MALLSRWRCALPALVLTACVGPALGQDDWTQPSSWTEPVSPFAVADSVYYVGTRGLAAYLFTTPQGHVLLDAPLEENVEHVLSSIRSLGFDPKDVRYLIASHGHFDHVGGLASAQEATGAQVVLSREAAELVARGGAGDFHLGDRALYPPVAADRVVEDGARLRLGRLELVAQVTPGHTRGCTSWSADVLVEGEPRRLVVICSLSVLPGMRLAGDDPSYPGIGDDYCRSVARLRSLDADVFLASHASFFGMERKRSSGEPEAFVDPGGLQRFLHREASRIEERLAQDGRPGGCPGS